MRGINNGRCSIIRLGLNFLCFASLRLKQPICQWGPGHSIEIEIVSPSLRTGKGEGTSCGSDSAAHSTIECDQVDEYQAH